ncbi:hypothetical protein [Streptomyces mexicanus]|uniref:hypothetical protein n=1 Tax=Streptomyces mexicanus TaxID=178566 RepID=UPI0031EA3DCF
METEGMVIAGAAAGEGVEDGTSGAAGTPPAARTAPDAGADPERDLNADGSTTIALRTVRSGDR